MNYVRWLEIDAGDVRSTFGFRVELDAKTKNKKERGGTLKLFCSPGLEYMI